MNGGWCRVAGGGELAGRDVPWWGMTAAAAAPLLLVAGLTAAAELQPPGFAAFSGTVSSLAAPGANDSWVMTLTFAFVGACEVATGLALRAAGRAGRLVLIGAGICGMFVAAFPEYLGGSSMHAFWAGWGFAGLVLWPVFALRRGVNGSARVPWALRPRTCARVTVTLAALTLWFAAEQATRGPTMGLAERAAGIAQTVWPLVVVVSCRRSAAEAGDFGFEPEGCEQSPG